MNDSINLFGTGFDEKMKILLEEANLPKAIKST